MASKQELEAIVRAVAASRPVYALAAWDDVDRSDACALCDAIGKAPREVKHKRSCPWVHARQAIEGGVT